MILRILGFFSSSFSRKIHIIPGSVAPPKSQGSLQFYDPTSTRLLIGFWTSECFQESPDSRMTQAISKYFHWWCVAISIVGRPPPFCQRGFSKIIQHWGTHWLKLIWYTRKPPEYTPPQTNQATCISHKEKNMPQKKQKKQRNNKNNGSSQVSFCMQDLVIMCKCSVPSAIHVNFLDP